MAHDAHGIADIRAEKEELSAQGEQLDRMLIEKPRPDRKD
jgi:hypothetical protein